MLRWVFVFTDLLFPAQDVVFVGAILGVFGGVVGKSGRRLDALGLDAAGARRIGLEGIHDFAIGLGRKLRHQHLDALILGFESDE